MNDVIKITEEMRNEKLEITLKDGYQFKDENGNVINATKIVLEKKKKERTYRPFKNKEECWAEMQKHQPFGWMKYKSGEAFYIVAIGNGNDFIRAYEKLTFADGTPFGIKEE